MQDGAQGGSQANAGTVTRLQAAKFLRATMQGTLVVVFALYLAELGWRASAIGLLFTAGGLVNAASGWLVGVTSDRAGRKVFLLVYEGLTVVLGLALVVTDHAAALALGAMAVGIGIAQSGLPGPVAAAEQAWMAEAVPAGRRGSVYSRNSALGFFGMALGSVMAGLVPFWEPWLAGALAYRPFFLLVAAAALVNLVLLRTAAGGAVGDLAAASRPDAAEPARHLQGDPEQVRRHENRLMIQMGLVNALNGLAVGLTGPLLAYWFNARFGVGPAEIGVVFSVTFVLTGAASLWTGHLSQRVGIVRAVMLMRLGSVVLLALLPLIPVFWLAAVVHVFRTALGRGTVGARQALAVSLVRPGRRGMASSLNQISMTLPISMGPSMAGVFIDAGRLGLPFYVAAVLQFLYGTLYGRLFAAYDIGPAAAGAPGPARRAPDTGGSSR